MRTLYSNKRHSFSVIYALIVSNLVGLIIVPTLAFLLQITTDSIYNKVALSNSLSALYETPWTLLSYAFFHTSLWHWGLNMILLYFTGVLFLNLFSWKQFLKIYVVGGIFGGIFFIFAHFLPALHRYQSQLLGASASIMAVLIFLCTYTPQYRISFWGIGIPLWGFGAFLVLMDILSLPYANTGGKIAHLGGALCGFVWASVLKFSFKEKKETKKIFRKQKHAKQLSEKEVEFQKKVDIILGKISKSGYDSLTDAEKSFLFTASKNSK